MNHLLRKVMPLFRTPILQQRSLSSNIFVSRLSFYTTEEELKKLFSRFGNIRNVRLIRDARTQRPKGFAFIDYSSEDEAQAAVKAMDGRIVAGRLIFVETAKSQCAEDTP